MIRYEKVLSLNDTGETGSHQSGILIPKSVGDLGLFPPLRASEKNPRARCVFIDRNQKEWELVFIYYNNARFGGTRDEYRITHVSAYIAENGLSSGDIIGFAIRGGKTRTIYHVSRESPSSKTDSIGDRIMLGSDLVAVRSKE